MPKWALSHPKHDSNSITQNAAADTTLLLLVLLLDTSKKSVK